MKAVLWVLSLVVVIPSGAQQLGPCDPLDPSRCGLPFPNNFWLRPNTTTGQLNIQFSPQTLPVDHSGGTIDPVAGGWNELDGFSPLSPAVTYFAGVSLANVPHYWNISASLDTDCSTVILDTVTGEIVPHFVELDDSSGESAKDEQLLMVWPAVRLENGRRYIVALRNLVVEKTGQLFNASYAFQALRDNITTTDPDIELRRALFADIFSRLWAVGFQRNANLQLAWDFTVGSRTSITSRLTFMRDDAFSRVQTGGIQFKIRNIIPNLSAQIIRQVEGSMYVPQYVDSPLPGATLVLNAQGVPVYQGMEWIPFTVLIPASLVGTTPNVTGSVLQYGHGLFGSREEVLEGYLQDQAEQHGYVLAASDWIGLSQDDAPVVAAMLATDITKFRMVPDRCTQGMVHALFLMRLLLEGNFSQSAAMTFNGQVVLNSKSVGYYNGNSQGGILGSVYMAVTTDVQRGVLGVGGGPYSILLPRSSDFAQLFDVIRFRYRNDIDRIHLLDFIQLLWDRAEPAGYMDAITVNPLPNTPTHQVVLQHGLGDAQVSYLGVYFLGRAVGASMFESNVYEPNELLWGFPFIPDKQIGNTAMQVTWVFPGVPPVPEINIPPPAQYDTHEYPRRQQDGQNMMWTFFTTGNIVNTCGGSCNGYIPSSPAMQDRISQSTLQARKRRESADFR